MSTPEKNIFSILGQSFGVYKKSAKYLAVITVLAFVPVFIFRQFIPQDNFVAFAYIITNFQYMLEQGILPDFANITQSIMFGDAATYVLIYTAIELTFFPLSTAAAVYLVGIHLAEKESTFGGMFSAAMPIFPKMIITSMISVAMIYFLVSFTIGFLGGFMLILALYFSVGMVFYQHVVADVRRWGLSAISISRFMIRGRWFRVFFGIIVIFACYMAAAAFLDFLDRIAGIYNNIFASFAYFLVQHFLLSFFAIVFALWYFEIKRVHSLNFQEVEKELMEKMREHMGRFGRETDEMKDEDENKDEN